MLFHPYNALVKSDIFEIFFVFVKCGGVANGKPFDKFATLYEYALFRGGANPCKEGKRHRNDKCARASRNALFMW